MYRDGSETVDQSGNVHICWKRRQPASQTGQMESVSRGESAHYCSTLFPGFQKRLQQVHFVVCSEICYSIWNGFIARLKPTPDFALMPNYMDYEISSQQAHMRGSACGMQSGFSLYIYANYHRQTRVLASSCPIRYFPYIRLGISMRSTKRKRSQTKTDMQWRGVRCQR